jgi:hypothetical protein
VLLSHQTYILIIETSSEDHSSAMSTHQEPQVENTPIKETSSGDHSVTMSHQEPQGENGQEVIHLSGGGK